MKFAEIMAALMEAAGDEPNPVYPDIQAAYDDDVSVYQGKIDALTEADAEKNTMITSLKNEIYDLNKQLGLTPSNDGNGDSDPESDPDPDENVDITIDDLFQ